MRFDLFRKHNTVEVMKPSRAIRDHLIHRFRLGTDQVDALRCIVRQHPAGGRDALDFRIFSPMRAQDLGISITTASELDAHPELVLFDGRIDEHGSIRMYAHRLHTESRTDTPHQ